LARENLANQVERIITTAMAGNAGPLHHGAHALAHAPSRLRLRPPNRGQYREHIGGRERADGLLATARKGIVDNGVDPLIDVLAVAPLLLADGIDRARRFFEGRREIRRRAGAASRV